MSRASLVKINIKSTSNQIIRIISTIKSTENDRTNKFTYSPVGKAFEKQIKTIEDQWEKQVEALEDLKDNKKDHKNN